jgi:geranylgeranyl diphosphate synthase type I
MEQMRDRIKLKIEKELTRCVSSLDKGLPLSRVSPLLADNLKRFVLRKGKRLRPAFFIAAYLGLVKGTPAAGLYKAAAAFELLHAFLLIHDDIVDKSATRRGKPSLHKILGNDLAIIAGDVLHTMAVRAFLSIKADPRLKEKALKMFLNSALYTETGEFIELLSANKDIESVSREDIYRIYDYKTARYTFAAPLACGAILAGAKQAQIDKLHKYGMLLGRAFQIKDDIAGMFGEEKKTGKCALTDLQEAKKTILLWYACRNLGKKNRRAVKRILLKKKAGRADLLKMRRLLTASGALDYALAEASALIKRAEKEIGKIPLFKPVQ